VDAVDALSERCDVLGEAWSWWATTLTGLDPAAWKLDTRLPGWDVAALAAHATLLIRGLGFLATRPLDVEPPPATAVDMLRRFNEPGGVATTWADMVADMARRQAETMSPEELVALFAVNGPEVVATIAAAGPIVVDYFGQGAYPIAEALSIAVLEAVVHGVDLCAALDVPPSSIPGAAVRHTVGLLAAVADPAAFIDAATGRGPTDVLPVIR
jgi:uncharacterized protein (TIGR03083 family)